MTDEQETTLNLRVLTAGPTIGPALSSHLRPHPGDPFYFDGVGAFETFFLEESPLLPALRADRKSDAAAI